jgi:flagellar protein FlaJ
MGMSYSQKLGFKLLGDKAASSAGLPKLQDALQKAHMTVRADAYMAGAWVIGAMVMAVSLVMSVLIIPIAVTQFDVQAGAFVLILLLPPMAAYISYWAILATPASKAKSRGKDMDMRLPYSTNYVAAMASAGVIPQEIFKSLAKQTIYGEMSKEAAWVYKDLHVHGKDIITALRRSTARSPSTKYQELLQGAITTITSGGDLTAYFRQKADRYQWENRVEQKSFIETMGLMAETYVTAAVAGPLFLIVIVAIIVLMGSGEISQLQMIVYLLLPVINIGFMMGLKSMIPEV